MRWLTALAGVLLAFQAQGQQPVAWINELHYDNDGADVNEFVEVAVHESITDLSALRLSLYNGNGGGVYESHRLSTFTAGEQGGAYRLYSKLIPGIQNGAPDGLSLDFGGALVSFLSYEGSITATGGPALGLTSSDIGLAEPLAGAAALGLVGAGESGEDFSWAALSFATPGALNVGQTIFAVPEPSPAALAVFGVGLLGGWWRLRKKNFPQRRRGAEVEEGS